MAGLSGLVQHRGIKKCVAAAKKKKQDAVMAREPTLLSYLCRKDTTLPTPANLVREVARNDAEDASRIVVRQVTTPKAIPNMMYTAKHANRNAQSNDKDTIPSVDQDLDSDQDQDLDLDKSLAWSTVKARAGVGEREPGCKPRATSTTPNTNTQIIVLTMHQTQHDAKEDTQTWVQSCEQEPRARPQAMPCTEWVQQSLAPPQPPAH